MKAVETFAHRCPILTHLDPELQFTVEVDASDTGLGAVLPQCSSTDKKLHPCTFFSWHLTPSERTYNVGNRELLAVVVPTAVAAFAGGDFSFLGGVGRPL